MAIEGFSIRKDCDTVETLGDNGYGGHTVEECIGDLGIVDLWCGDRGSFVGSIILTSIKSSRLISLPPSILLLPVRFPFRGGCNNTFIQGMQWSDAI